MALRLPEYRPPAAPQAIPTNVPLSQIVQVMGQNPYAQAIDQITPILSQAMNERAKRKRQGQANQTLASSLGLDVPEGTDLSSIPTENLIQTANAKTANEKANMFDFAGLSGDQKNMIVLNKRTGSTELRPLPDGFTPKTGPKPPPGTQNPNQVEGQWQKLTDKVNSLRASSRSALGAAALANQKADRAIYVLGDPNAPPQKIDYAITDLSSIFQNGSPHETSLDRQQYDTLKQKFINLKTYITGKPQAINQPEIRKQLMDTVKEIKNVDNQIVGNNLGIEGVGFEGIVNSNPKRWQRLMDAVNKTTLNPIDVSATQDPNGDKGSALRSKYGY